MRKEIFDEVIEINGKKLPINTHQGKKSCYVEMLTAIEREMTAMLSNDRKVLMFRFDIHIKEYTPDNKVISDCLNEVKKFIKKNYKDCERIGYVWCREQQTVKHQHYHVFMMVNGSKIDDTFKIFEEIKKISDRTPLLARPHIAKNSYTMVNRGDDDAFNEAFYRASYLAKTRTKGYKGVKAKKGERVLDRVNNYNATNIKPRLNEHGQIFTAGDDYKKAIAAKANRAKQVTPKTTATDKPIHMMTDAERQLPLFA